MNPERLTVRAMSLMWNEAIRRGQPLPRWTLGDFVDDFRLRCTTNEAKMALVREEPAWVEAASEANCNAYWAAMVEMLCREAGLKAPDWTESSRCYLHRPWFAGGLENLKAVLLVESPVAFRRRNLFVSANVLVRA